MRYFRSEIRHADDNEARGEKTLPAVPVVSATSTAREVATVRVADKLYKSVAFNKQLGIFIYVELALTATNRIFLKNFHIYTTEEVDRIVFSGVWTMPGSCPENVFEDRCLSEYILANHGVELEDDYILDLREVLAPRNPLARLHDSFFVALINDANRSNKEDIFGQATIRATINNALAVLILENQDRFA